MDVSTLIHILKDEVTCVLCSNVYTNPKQLPCFHVFCLECLNNLARTSAHHGDIKCPLCNVEVAVHENGWTETLPSSLYVKNLLDTLAIRECNTSKVTCGNCDEKHEEMSYCFHCGKFWCKDCLNAHNILKENKEHRVLALKDFQDKDFEDLLKRPIFKFYCTVCDTPMSQTCVTVERRQQKSEKLIPKVVKSNITSKLVTAKESSNAISSYIRELEKKSRLLDYRSKINKEQIQQTVESLSLTLRQKEGEAIVEVENQTKKAQEQLRRHKDKLQDHLKRREQSISQIERLVERSTGAELVRTKTVIDELFQGLQEPQDVKSTIDWKTVTVFVKNEESAECLQKLKIGDLATKQTATEASQCSVEGIRAATAGLETEIEVITRDSEGEQYYCPGDYICAELIPAREEQMQNTVVEMKITDKNNGSYVVSFIPSVAGSHLLTVQVNGETIVDFSPIDIKERAFRPVGFIPEGPIESQSLRQTLLANQTLGQTLVAVASRMGKKSKLNYPWGVTSNDSNEIFVSDMDNNRIVVFNEKGEFIRSFGQKLLNKPTGICIDKENRIFVVNRGSNKILLFNSKGELVTEVHNGESFQEPRGISITAQGNFFVCDSGNQCLQFISPNGSILKTIGKGELCKPFDCLCYEDKVFVSDREAHLIKVYSNSDGRFLYEFGRYGTVDVELNGPSGLAMDKAGHLLVCSGYLLNSPHRIHVYTLDGKLVTMFGGSDGKQLGHFKCPNSVTVLKNGRIVVCEFGNCRLQMFE